MSDDNKAYLTPEGKESIERELRDLIEIQRPELAQKLKEAVAQGDLKENADYHDAKERQGFIEGRIADLEATLRRAVIIEKSEAGGAVQLGNTVTIREAGTKDDEVYMIVGSAEANAREGKISNESPIGQALIGKKKGDKVKVQTPGGKMEFKIRKIE
ncbi:MAG: transcription elongation factor GreA [Chloroflexota bacterium]